MHECWLVDGSGLIFRAYHALRAPMTRPDGTPTNAIHGMAQMLVKALDEWQPKRIAVLFDAAGPTFRHDIAPSYKANRPEPPEDLVPQFPLARDLVRAFGITSIEKPGYEADDLIATLARHAVEQGGEVVIASSDKDLMQLLRPGIRMFDPMKEQWITPEYVQEKFGVAPEKMIDLQALAGDATDNIPGAPGIGPKIGAELLANWGSLDELLAHASEIRQPKRRAALIDHRDAILVSRQLVTLSDQVEIDRTDMTCLDWVGPDAKKLIRFLMENALRTLHQRICERLLPQYQLTAPEIEAISRQQAGELAELGQLAGSFRVAYLRTESPPPAPVLGQIPLALPEPEYHQPTSAPTDPHGAMLDSGYELVQDETALQRWITASHEAGEIGFDTETTGLDAASAGLVGISIACAPGLACYIPLGHLPPQRPGEPVPAFDQPAPQQIPLRQALAMLKPLLEDRSVRKVGHNIKYDWLVLSRPEHGAIEMRNLGDSMLLSYVISGQGSSPSLRHSLDAVARRELQYETIPFASVTGTGRAQISFARVDLRQAAQYAAEDADITLRLYRLLSHRLGTTQLVTTYETMERPLIPVLARMERAGIRVDSGVLADLSREFADRMVEIDGRIQACAGKPLNPGSPKQLGEILFVDMGVRGAKRRSASGGFPTGSDVLEKITQDERDSNPRAAELAEAVLDWRHIAKLKNTYSDALHQAINGATGRVHTSYAMTGVSTGRLSSNNPNLQNIPIRTSEGRRIREAFVARPGHLLLSADYSQIELRLAAHIAGVENLRAAFASGADIHTETAAQIFGVPIDQVDAETRRRAKSINFGILYGMSSFGLARQLGIRRGEAQHFIDSYLGRMAELSQWIAATHELARRTGAVWTLFGRKITVRGIDDRNHVVRSAAERAAINAPIQGSAADLIKRAMIRVGPALCKAGLRAELLLQVHDELVFEVPEEEAETSAGVIVAVMEKAAAPVVMLRPSLLVMARWAANWNDAH